MLERYATSSIRYVTNILHVSFADGQAIIAMMDSDLQQALHILHAILKNTTSKFLLKKPKPWDLTL